MHFSLSTVAALALATLVLAAPAAKEKRTLNSTSTNPEIITSLLDAPTGRDRVAILTNDDDFTYDFLHPPTAMGIATGLGGHTVTANRNTMPGLIGTGSSMTVGFLGPCGMNTPHTHPRGTELNIVVKGRLVTSFIAENGARVVHNNGSLYQMAAFAQGALHMEFNPDCKPAVFVASFNNEDAAVLQMANAFFMLDENVVRAALGAGTGDIVVDGKDLDLVRTIIPENVAKGVEECLQKCGLTKRTWPPLEQMKRDLQAAGKL